MVATLEFHQVKEGPCSVAAVNLTFLPSAHSLILKILSVFSNHLCDSTLTDPPAQHSITSNIFSSSRSELLEQQWSSYRDHCSMAACRKDLSLLVLSNIRRSVLLDLLLQFFLQLSYTQLVLRITKLFLTDFPLLPPPYSTLDCTSLPNPNFSLPLNTYPLLSFLLPIHALVSRPPL
ncbi:hypothetical protein Tco_0824515 [Tanacetum coccineum]|uniref:Uncharacterized protein n=1 Tax=Tanacetum coccineum TaxID=301880 RepID=A0ABQ5APW5_9ASTR